LDLINKTEFASQVNEITFKNLSDGTYYYNATVIDKAGLESSTETRSFVIDTTIPIVSYLSGTEIDGNLKNQSHIFIRVSITEPNIDKVTYFLFDSSKNLVNKTEFTSPVSEFTFTKLNEGIYYYNMAVRDKSGQEKGTGTRNIILDTSAPKIEFKSKSPVHDSFLTENNLVIVVKINEINFKRITYSLFDESLTLIKEANFNTQVTKYVFSNLDPDVYHYNVKVKDKLDFTTTTSLRKVTKINPISFNGSTTDLSKVNIHKIPRLTVESTPYGKIIYDSDIDLEGIEDLSAIIKVGFNRIEIVSTSLSTSNTPATLYFYNLKFKNPRILKDGKICSKGICRIKSYSGGRLVFGIKNFSVFTSEESPEEEKEDDEEEKLRKARREELFRRVTAPEQPTQEQESVKVIQEDVSQETQRGATEREGGVVGVPESVREQEDEIISSIEGYGIYILSSFITLFLVMIIGLLIYLHHKRSTYDFESEAGKKLMKYILLSKLRRNDKIKTTNKLRRMGWPDDVIEEAFERMEKEKKK